MKRGTNYCWKKRTDLSKIIITQLYDMTNTHIENCINFIKRNVIENPNYTKDNVSGYGWLDAFYQELAWRECTNKSTVKCKTIWRG